MFQRRYEHIGTSGSFEYNQEVPVSIVAPLIESTSIVAGLCKKQKFLYAEEALLHQRCLVMMKDEGPTVNPDFRAIWDTENLLPQDRYPFFHEALCQSFSAFTPAQVDPTTLKARFRKANLSKSALLSFFVTPHRVYRSPADSARIPGEFLIMGCHLRGAQNLTVRKKSFEQPTGSVFVSDFNEISSADIVGTERFLSTAIIFSRSMMIREIGFAPVYKKIEEGNEALIKICLTRLSSIIETATYQEIDHLSEAARHLLYSGLLSDPEYLESCVSPQSSAAEGMMLAIDKIVRDNLSDASLSVQSAASRLGISARYIQKLFNERGTTFGKTLRDARLEAIQKDLAAIHCRSLSVSEIAKKHGLTDQSTFHRTFKERFNETPLRMRSRLLGRNVI